MSAQYILTDLAGVTVGEITNADERKVSLPHMRVANASFKLPLWHPLANTALTTDCLVKAYYTDDVTGTRTLAFNGPVLTAQEVGDPGAQSIAFTAASPLWRLTRRLVPGTLQKTGTGLGSSEGSPIDLGLIAFNALDDTNGFSFTGISKGSRTASTNGWVQYRQIKTTADVIAELHLGLNSFEFRVNPTEPTNVAGVGGWPQIGTLDIAPLLGTTKPDAVFEYGTTAANVARFERAVTRETLLTRAVISLSGWPDGTDQDLRIIPDALTMASRGVFEELVADGGVTDDGLRDQIGNFHVQIRQNPRQTILFNPAVNARPAPFVDYNVGDTVRARAEVRGSVRFDALFRVWGLTITTDKNGNDSVELELVMP